MQYNIIFLTKLRQTSQYYIKFQASQSTFNTSKTVNWVVPLLVVFSLYNCKVFVTGLHINLMWQQLAVIFIRLLDYSANCLD